MPQSGLQQLTSAAKLLRPLLGELVFVGGSVTGLLVTDPAAGEPRSTLDVDAVAELTTYAEYTAFGNRMRILGFHEDTRAGAPVCRWVCGDVVLDVMPLDTRVLGFSNRWYREALESATLQRLAMGLDIRLITAPCFVATKLEAFGGRGSGDIFASHDLEDILAVVDGRPALVNETKKQSAELQRYLQMEVGNLLRTPGFAEAIPGYLLPDAISQSRISVVLERLSQLASLL
jgi:hypothetical protein